MNQNLQSIMHPFMPDVIFKAPHIPQETTTQTPQHNSYDLASADGQNIGYLKAWWDEDDFAGFVRFDREWNVVEWKCFKLNPSGRHVQPN